jgi:hypothetical protein
MPVKPEVLKKLKIDTPDEAVQWKPVFDKKGEKKKGHVKVVPYIDARFIYRTLNDILGAENWSLSSIRDQQGDGFTCIIRILVEYEDATREWVHRSGSSDNTQWEGYKGAESRAICRAAAKFGLGDDLYDVEGNIWVRTDKRGKPIPPKLSDYLDRIDMSEDEAEEGEHKEEYKEEIQKLQKVLHSYGKTAYGDEWEKVRHTLVDKATSGDKKGFSDGLTYNELEIVEEKLRGHLITQLVGFLPLLTEEGWMKHGITLAQDFFRNDKIKRLDAKSLDDCDTNDIVDFYIELKQDALYCSEGKPIVVMVDDIWTEQGDVYFIEDHRRIEILAYEQFLPGVVSEKFLKRIEGEKTGKEELEAAMFAICRMEDKDYVMEDLLSLDQYDEWKDSQ